MAAKPWWEQWPHCLEKQRSALKEAGIEFSEKVREGKKHFQISHNLKGEKLELKVVFPDLFPYFRFAIIAENLDLPRHQNPMDKNLCLLGRSTHYWKVEDTVADFILNRLPIALKAGRSKIPLPKLEETQAEPISVFYSYYLQVSVLIDGSWQIDPSLPSGTFIMQSTRQGQLVVNNVRDDHENPIAEMNPMLLKSLHPNKSTFRWVRVKKALKSGEPKEFEKELLTIWPKLKSRELKPDLFLFAPRDDKEVSELEVIGVIYPEETAVDGGWKYEDSWVFLCRTQTKKLITKKGRQPLPVPTGSVTPYLLKADRAGIKDCTKRAPEISLMTKKKITVLGLGCLGAPSVIEFARNGVGELRLVDHDRVEMGNTLRWPLGLTACGKFKTEALKCFVRQQYPYTAVETLNIQIGSPFESTEAGEQLLTLLTDTDLIYDASAEFGVQHFLSKFAKENRIPYVWVQTTPGGWGGIVGRQLPEGTGCWTCFQANKYYGGEEWLPNQDPQDMPIQPAGCANPTFIGTSFDIGQVSLAGVRHAVSTLLGDAEKGAYPKTDWDVAVINLRNNEGKLIAPEWNTKKLEKHPKCPYCGTGKTR